MPNNYITLSQLTKTTKGLVNKINTEQTITNNKIGNLTNLNTTAKTDLVAAINEAAASGTSYDDTALVGRVTALENAGYITSYTETDPVFTASAAAGISSTDIANWNAKSDFSGSYEDLEDKPTIPEVFDWALAANKPTYTASEVGALPSTYTAPVTSVNEETGNVIINKIKTTAPSNNVEYNLMGTTSNNNTTAVFPYNQDLLLFAKTTDFSRLTIGSTSMPGKVRLYSSADSASGYTELKSNASSTNTREVVFPDASGTVALTTDIPSVPSWALAASKPSYTFSELTSHPATLNDYGITDAYTKTEVDGLVSGVLHYKGTKANVSALPSSGNATGDVWHITADSSEWAWDGSDWQELGTAVDLTGYLQTGDIAAWAKAANKPTYTASEVGAAESGHTHGNITNAGAITSNTALASGDRLVFSDSSDSNLLKRSSITIGSSTTQYLANNGSWQNLPTISVSQTITSGTEIGSVNNTKLYAPTPYDDTELAARVTALEELEWATYYSGRTAPSNS